MCMDALNILKNQDDYINALDYKKYPLYDAIALISDSHPNMTVKEVRNIVNILIESGIVKDERPINAEQLNS